MPLRIFISYSTNDLAAANAIWTRLGSAGHAVYFAEVTARAGTRLPVELEQQIKACDVFVVLWSQNAKESEWVSQEIGIAQGANKEILPVILEANLQAPGFIRDRKYLPAYQGFQQALDYLSHATAHHAEEKRKKEALLLLGLGVIILLAISK